MKSTARPSVSHHRREAPPLAVLGERNLERRQIVMENPWWGSFFPKSSWSHPLVDSPVLTGKGSASGGMKSTAGNLQYSRIFPKRKLRERRRVWGRTFTLLTLHLEQGLGRYGPQNSTTSPLPHKLGRTRVLNLEGRHRGRRTRIRGDMVIFNAPVVGVNLLRLGGFKPRLLACSFLHSSRINNIDFSLSQHMNIGALG